VIVGRILGSRGFLWGAWPGTAKPQSDSLFTEGRRCPAASHVP
jgi:hypothetical protein